VLLREQSQDGWPPGKPGLGSQKQTIYCVIGGGSLHRPTPKGQKTKQRKKSYGFGGWPDNPQMAKKKRTKKGLGFGGWSKADLGVDEPHPRPLGVIPPKIQTFFFFFVFGF
jgi:hypothetical protein